MKQFKEMVAARNGNSVKSKFLIDSDEFIFLEVIELDWATLNIKVNKMFLSQICFQKVTDLL